MDVPQEYAGREHTWLKHRVLQLYLAGWAHKLASVARRRTVRLWYVDCFSGPWKARDQDLQDTSISIGLRALESAARTWANARFPIELGAIFVEKNPKAFSALQEFLKKTPRNVATHPLPGSFGECVGDIENLIQRDPAFLFVDPTGWKGAGMVHIAPLARRAWRDVMVNVMFDHINRFKDHPREFLRNQMRDFFGLKEADLPTGMGEQDLLVFYRRQPKKTCGLDFALDLAIPHPVRDRTKLRLVVGGHNPEVVRLFRQVERQVLGGEAAAVRVAAKERDKTGRTGQASLPGLENRHGYEVYEQSRREGLAEVRQHLPSLLASRRSVEYGRLWPRVLESCHVAETDLRTFLLQLKREGVIEISNWDERDRTVKDQHLLAPKGRS